MRNDVSSCFAKETSFLLDEVASLFVKFEEKPKWKNRLGCSHILASCLRKSSSSSRIFSSDFGNGTKNSIYFI